MANEKGISANLENMTANKLLDIANDKTQPQKLRAAAKKELSTRSMGADKTPGPRMAKGGDAKKKVPVISIGVGMAEMKPGKKAEMAYGGSVKGKKHNYAAGGSVTDNAGLRALKKASPEAYNKITGK
jgi:hypothetical protein